ncbi:DUF4149 domain-containing protein [Piscinibacter gummiphilus]|uniref:TMEM205-like domain-containing protein n=1 Tax=Piscinibacter gummiphilus TaxID=946333 RepID=A0A1W6LAS7_9BURK|nr:DUF4149 domain-containing protein [Piscinibacter gummiphilus]ARN21330.1 hypothetical protein A4W93_16275 [Piscinibacter gummiphilus]GLS96333.1 hypothetical protein GCM10007918_36250 [Piscinibacter gummiphilus]
MARPDPRRVAAVLAGLWAGAVLAVAFIGTPAGFALVPRDVAGKLAGFMLTREAYLSIAMSVVLFLVVRAEARAAARLKQGSVLSANVLLVMGALFCTVFGHFGIGSAMDAAREGKGALSFGALHGISVAVFGLKGLLVLALAWRLTAPR